MIQHCSLDLLHGLVVSGLQRRLKSNTVDDNKALKDEIMLLKDAMKPEVIRLSLRRKSSITVRQGKAVMTLLIPLKSHFVVNKPSMMVVQGKSSFQAPC